MEVDSQANILYDRLLQYLKRERNITEALKANDQMKWMTNVIGE